MWDVLWDMLLVTTSAGGFEQHDGETVSPIEQVNLHVYPGMFGIINVMILQ